MKIPLWIPPALSVVLLFGSIGVASATGDWITSGRQQIAAGQRITVDDFKGWMTFQTAADGVGLPVETLIDLVDAPAGTELTPATAFKDVETLVPGFSLETYREVVRAYLAGQPLPSTGTPVASATPAATTSSPSPWPSVTPTASHAPTGSAQSISGQTTLRLVAQAYGLDLATLVAESGLPADINVDLPLRELKNVVPGYEIQRIRDAVAKLV